MTIYRKPVILFGNFDGVYLPESHEVLDIDGEHTPGNEPERLDPEALDLAAMISAEPDNGLRMSVVDDKLFAEVSADCVFDLDDIISTEAGNRLRPSILDGKMYAEGCEDIDLSTMLSSDPNNGLGFGSDGKFWFDGTADCPINISELLSTEAGNDIHLSIVDGKIFGKFSGECDINIVELISPVADNRLQIGLDGKIYLPPYDCQFDLADWVSENQWNRLKLDGTDGKLLTLSEDQVSTSRPVNVLKSHTAGDHKLYVDPADLISSDAGPGLDTGADGKLTVNLVAMFSTMRVVTGRVLPAGGQWAYIAFSRHTDGDVEGDWFMQNVMEAGVAAGGTTIEASAEEIKMIAWQVAA